MGPNHSALNPRNGVQIQQPMTLFSKKRSRKSKWKGGGGGGGGGGGESGGEGDSIFKVVLFYRSRQLGVKSFYRM